MKSCSEVIKPARLLRVGDCFFCDPDLSEVVAVVGLGNPGSRFEGTRHNVGFKVLDSLSQSLGFIFYSKGNLEYSRYLASNGRKLLFVKPHTFMNSSGIAMSFLTKQGISPHQILVVHDELERKLGALAVRFGGGARGHNGLRSIINVIGKEFWRLQFGIGRPEQKSEVPGYVLATFAPSEQKVLNDAINEVVRFFSCSC